MHIIFFIYLFLFINNNTEKKSNIYTLVNMKRNICPVKLNYIMIIGVRRGGYQGDESPPSGNPLV